MEILERHIAFESDADAFQEAWAEREQSLAAQILAARELVDGVGYSKRDLFTIASLTSKLHIDGHRADLVILKAARAHAAFEGRDTVTNRDILMATELAIPHRLKRGPFSDASMNLQKIAEDMDEIASEWGEGDEVEMDAEGEESPVKKKASQ
jgi:Mg-chelatase subunit ChlI